MSVLPLQLAFYRGASGQHGAVQFNLQRPHYYLKDNPKMKNYEGRFIPPHWLNEYPNLTESDLTSREGALFMEITSATGKNEYDWKNKILLALSITDMGKLLMVLEGLSESEKIIHDPNMKSANAGKVYKHLEISSPKGIKAGVLLSVSQKEKDNAAQVTKHVVPLSGDEARTLAICLRAVIPAALAWV